MKYNTVIFDMDGTLLDTLQDLADSINHALAACAMPTWTVDEVRGFVGGGVVQLVSKAVPPGATPAETTRCMELFCAHYGVNKANKTAPYLGVLELLARLKAEGYGLSIVSNKLDIAVKALSESYFPGLIPVAIGEQEGMARKPAPDMVFKALAELGVTAEGAVYVGDSDVDLTTAQNAGLPCIAVSWGFRGRDFLLAHGAALVVDDADGLYRALK